MEMAASDKADHQLATLCLWKVGGMISKKVIARYLLNGFVIFNESDRSSIVVVVKCRMIDRVILILESSKNSTDVMLDL